MGANNVQDNGYASCPRYCDECMNKETCTLCEYGYLLTRMKKCVK